MDSTRAIQVAVARADLAVCAVPRWAVVIVLVLLALVVGLVVVAVLRDPDWIDYDAPGVDITSEGPDEYTEAWFEWDAEQEGGEGHGTHHPGRVDAGGGCGAGNLRRHRDNRQGYRHREEVEDTYDGHR